MSAPTAAAQREVPLATKLVSATLGALITSITTNPIEVVKTRMQTASSGGGAAHLAALLQPGDGVHASTPGGPPALATVASARRSPPPLLPLPPPPASGAWGTLRALVRSEGVWVLWSGLAPALAMAAPSTALYFVVYEELKHAIEAMGVAARGSSGGAVDARGGWASEYAPLLAGVAARSVTVAAVAPLELVRTLAMYKQQPQPLAALVAGAHGTTSSGSGPGRPPPTHAAAMAASLSSGFGIAPALRAEVAAGGMASLWRGLGPTLWRDVPFSGIYWLSYERLKTALLRRWAAPPPAPRGARAGLRSLPPSLEHTFGASFLAGMLAGGVAAAATTPFDVIKTRRQVQFYHQAAAAAAAAPGAAAMQAAQPRGATTWVLLRELLAREGLSRGLFAGVLPRVAKVAPSCAIMISSYEAGKLVLGPDRARDCDAAAAALPNVQ